MIRSKNETNAMNNKELLIKKLKHCLAMVKKAQSNLLGSVAKIVNEQ